jgi:hypothetical protein
MDAVSNRSNRVLHSGAFILLAMAPLCLAAPLEGQRISGWDGVAEPGGRQFNIQLLREWGGPVIPIFEGWYQNPDGTYELSFGYFNVNTEELIEIPLGPDNFIEPREFDGLQPTHFLPVPQGERRHLGVFTVNVPEDFGERDVVWTLRVNDETFRVPGRVKHLAFRLEGAEQEGRQTSSPWVRFSDGGKTGRGPAGVHVGPLAARVGEPLPIEVWTGRENPFRDDARPVNLRWFKHQGPGRVEFSAVDQRVPLGSEGPATTLATFHAPGEYVVRVRAWNTFTDYEFHCCWSNGFVRVLVR